jgi:hypothetical protein
LKIPKQKIKKRVLISGRPIVDEDNMVIGSKYKRHHPQEPRVKRKSENYFKP